MKGKNSLRIAVIGTGSDAVKLASTLNVCSSSTIVGLCDPQRNGVESECVRDLNVPVFDRIEQLPSIGDVDVIVDLTEVAAGISGIPGLENVTVIRDACADTIRALADDLASAAANTIDIASVGREFSTHKKSADIYHAIVDSALAVTHCAAGSLIIFNERTETCRLAEAIGYSKEIEETVWELQPGGITEQLLDNDAPLHILDINDEPLFDNPVMNEGTISVLAATLREGGEVIGLLFVGDFKPRHFTVAEIDRFTVFSSQATLALQKALLIEKNEELSITDPLTGLFNIKHFFSALELEVNRAQRYGGYFAVVLMDIDNLNSINDWFGHVEGDRAIKRVATTITACSRLTDYKARYGGDEFVLILPSTSCTQASVLANRIRRAVNDSIIEKDDKEMQLSVSIGIAEFPSLGENVDELMNAVSTALYVSKQRGKNLVCCYEETCG
ncbi:MAG TPA: diguanylate cyclase [Candidatus Aquicultor sp.]|jgi:diguanylate cyclase (GGDEF)-like protein